VRITLNLLYTLSEADGPNIPYDQPHPPQLLKIRSLALQSFSHDFSGFINEGKQTMHIITAIKARNQLVTRPKKFYPNKLVKS